MASAITISMGMHIRRFIKRLTALLLLFAGGNYLIFKGNNNPSEEQTKVVEEQDKMKVEVEVEPTKPGEDNTSSIHAVQPKVEETTTSAKGWRDFFPQLPAWFHNPFNSMSPKMQLEIMGGLLLFVESVLLGFLIGGFILSCHSYFSDSKAGDTSFQKSNHHHDSIFSDDSTIVQPPDGIPQMPDHKKLTSKNNNDGKEPTNEYYDSQDDPIAKAIKDWDQPTSQRSN